MAGYVDFASSSEEEFPDLDVVLLRSKQIRRAAKAPFQDTTSRNDEDVSPSRQLEEEAIRWNVSTRKSCGHKQPGGSGTAPSTVIRRRKLGAKTDNALLKPLGASGSNEDRNLFDLPAKIRKSPDMSVRELRVRSRGATPTDLSSREVDDESGDNTDEQTEITEADISEFFGDSQSEFDEDENPTRIGREKPTSQNRPQLEAAPTLKAPSRSLSPSLGIDLPKHDPLKDVKARQQDSAKTRAAELCLGSDFGGPKSVVVDLTDGVTDALGRLDM